MLNIVNAHLKVLLVLILRGNLPNIRLKVGNYNFNLKKGKFTNDKVNNTRLTAK